jgi:hypothetical protein
MDTQSIIRNWAKQNLPAAAARAPRRVWVVYSEPDRNEFGLIVTNRDDPTRIAAWLPFGGPLDDDPNYLREMLEAAHEIAVKGDEASRRAWDHVASGHLGELDSEKPVPDALFSAFIGAVGGDPLVARALMPFCRYRLAEMVMTFNRRRFPDAPKKLIYHMIGLCEHPDGQGGNECEAIAAADRPLMAGHVEHLIGPSPCEYADEDFLKELAAHPSAYSHDGFCLK